MLMKKLTALLATACMLTSVAATSVSAANGVTLQNPVDDAWGYNGYLSEKLPYGVVNWGGGTLHTVSDGNGGYALRISGTGADWICLTTPYSSLPEVAQGTKLTVSFDTVGGPKQNDWDGKMGSTSDIDLMLHFAFFNEYADPSVPLGSIGKDKWTTWTKDITVSGSGQRNITVQAKNADAIIDNLKVVNKDTGEVIYFNDFNKVAPTSSNSALGVNGWGWTTNIWNLEADPFPNWTLNSYTGGAVVVADNGSNGYAMGATVLTADANPQIRATGISPLPADTYTVEAWIKFGGSNGWPNETKMQVVGGAWPVLVRDDTENKHQNSDGSFMHAKATVTVGDNWTPAIQLLGDCAVFIDEFKITNNNGDVVFYDDFEYVPGLSWRGINVTSDLKLTADASKVEATAGVTNLSGAKLPATLIMCAYDADGNLESVESVVTSEIAQSDVSVTNPKTNETLLTATAADVSELSGKTVTAFLWDSFSGMKALTDAKSITIE